MNLRIAYYVVAVAISLAAFAGAYGYASDAAAAYDKARNTAKLAQNHSLGAFIASNAADDKSKAADDDFIASNAALEATAEYKAVAAGAVASAKNAASVAAVAKGAAAYKAADDKAKAAAASSKAGAAANTANTAELAAEAAYKAVFVTAYGMAAAVSLAAVASAYILHKRREA